MYQFHQVEIEPGLAVDKFLQLQPTSRTRDTINGWENTGQKGPRFLNLGGYMSEPRAGVLFWMIRTFKTRTQVSWSDGMSIVSKYIYIYRISAHRSSCRSKLIRLLCCILNEFTQENLRGVVGEHFLDLPLCWSEKKMVSALLFLTAGEGDRPGNKNLESNLRWG